MKGGIIGAVVGIVTVIIYWGLLMIIPETSIVIKILNTIIHSITYPVYVSFRNILRINLFKYQIMIIIPIILGLLIGWIVGMFKSKKQEAVVK